MPVAFQKGFRWNVSNTTLFGETSPSNPLTPFLIQYYTAPENQRTPDYAAALANGGLDPINHFYPARLGEVLDIVIQNVAGPSGVVEAHPWHFHGAKVSAFVMTRRVNIGLKRMYCCSTGIWAQDLVISATRLSKRFKVTRRARPF